MLTEEAECIISECVSTRNQPDAMAGVGFLRDWRRANVGLTRARWSSTPVKSPGALKSTWVRPYADYGSGVAGSAALGMRLSAFGGSAFIAVVL